MIADRAACWWSCAAQRPLGTAKTLLAQLSPAVGLDFGRIQFTPDLDARRHIGINLFNFQTSSFTSNCVTEIAACRRNQLAPPGRARGAA